jgi:hypothetical protein
MSRASDPSSASDSSRRRPRSASNRIPKTLFDRLIAIRPHLAHQGAVQKRLRRRRPSWRLRVRIPHADYGRIQTSIELGGDPRVVEAVQQLVASWRIGPKTKRRRPKVVKPPATSEIDELRSEILKTSGAGWRRRRRIRAEFDEASKSPFSLMSYVMAGSFMTAKQSGRPRAAALA